MPSSPNHSTRLATLLDTGREELTREAVAEARALGREAAGAVVRELLAAELERSRARHQALNAAALAGELRLVPAVPALVACIERLSEADPVAHAAVDALARLREKSVDALLAAFERGSTTDDRRCLAYVLARTGVRDPRIRAAFVRLLAEAPVPAAYHLAEYGDRRSLADLSEALDRAAPDPPDADPLTANDHIVELASAIRRLGGTFTPEQNAKVEAVLYLREEQWRSGALFDALGL